MDDLLAQYAALNEHDKAICRVARALANDVRAMLDAHLTRAKAEGLDNMDIIGIAKAELQYNLDEINESLNGE